MTDSAASAADGSHSNDAARGRNSVSDPASSSGASAGESLPELDAGATSPEEIWDDFFSKRRPDAETVRRLVAKLHDAGKHDHVVAAVQAALRHGQSQPWMYEVLALSLKIQGAPRSEIERALLSQVDFSATDPAGLMLSAAYLARFDADEPALRLYRQASDLGPERQEPYLLGLKHAVALKDDAALAWAVRGIFASAWGKDHVRQHRSAEDAVNNRIRELREAGNPDQAEALASVLAEAKQVDLVVRLDWNGEGALDLLVREPNGAVCSFNVPRTPGGGVHAHDGHGPDQSNCYDEYVCAAGFPGVYRIEVRHGWGDIVGKRAKLTITRHRGTPHESTREISVPVTDEGETVRVTLTSGRRVDLLTVPDEPPTDSVTHRRTPLPKLVGRADADEIKDARKFRDTLFRQAGGFAGGRNAIGGVGAVGYQPTVTVIPDGLRLTANAVVSEDRRYVRLSLSPTFTQVIDVFRFTFVTTAP